MAVDKNDIIALLKQKGPLVPTEIKSKVGGDTIIVGAILSEQMSKGVIKVSHLKRGGSPFYFLPGQEAQLEKHKDLLDPKDQKTLELLREKKVLQDASQELFYRVSLRKLKDFAKELKANTVYGELLFWRYHLTSEEEAMDILRKRYGRREEASSTQAKSDDQQAPASKESTSQESTGTQEQTVKEQTPVQETQVRETTSQPQESQTQESYRTRPTEQKTAQQQSTKNTSTEQPSRQQTNTLSAQKELSNQEFEPTAFYEKAMNYFSNKNIKVLSQAQVTKNREYDFTVLVGTDVGELKMFARAKSKKKLNEGDVAPALLKAKTKELPCLFLTDGEFTKKGLKLMESEYKGLMIDYV